MFRRSKAVKLVWRSCHSSFCSFQTLLSVMSHNFATVTFRLTFMYVCEITILNSDIETWKCLLIVDFQSLSDHTEDRYNRLVGHSSRSDHRRKTSDRRSEDEGNSQKAVLIHHTRSQRWLLWAGPLLTNYTV